MIIITDKDTELDQVASPRNLVKVLPHYEQMFEGMREFQKQVEETGTTTNYGRVGRGGKVGFKLLARMPEAVLTWLLVLEPDLIKDPKTFRKFFRKHPEYRAYAGQNY